MEELISRQAVLDLMQLKMGGKELYKAVYTMPLVTPTHGTCKDCKHNYKTSRNTFECSNGHRFYMRIPDTFYCADYEKRGSENDI